MIIIIITIVPEHHSRITRKFSATYVRRLRTCGSNHMLRNRTECGRVGRFLYTFKWMWWLLCRMCVVFLMRVRLARMVDCDGEPVSTGTRVSDSSAWNSTWSAPSVEMSGWGRRDLYLYVCWIYSFRTTPSIFLHFICLSLFWWCALQPCECTPLCLSDAHALRKISIADCAKMQRTVCILRMLIWNANKCLTIDWCDWWLKKTSDALQSDAQGCSFPANHSSHPVDRRSAEVYSL